MSDVQKLAEFIMLLTGKAVEWAMAVWEAGDKALASYFCFTECLFTIQKKGMLEND